MNDFDLRICTLWEAGLDTLEIARQLSGKGEQRVRECDVYNRLPSLRAQRRAERAQQPLEAPPF